VCQPYRECLIRRAACVACVDCDDHLVRLQAVAPGEVDEGGGQQLGIGVQADLTTVLDQGLVRGGREAQGGAPSVCEGRAGVQKGGRGKRGRLQGIYNRYCQGACHASAVLAAESTIIFCIKTERAQSSGFLPALNNRLETAIPLTHVVLRCREPIPYNKLHYINRDYENNQL